MAIIDFAAPLGSFTDYQMASQPNQFGQRDGARRIAKVELDDGRVIEVTADDEPQVRPRQAHAGFNDPQKGKITDNRAFAAFLDSRTGPGGTGQTTERFFDRARAIAW